MPYRSENSKFLVTQHGDPDWTLVVWRWYSGKVLASIRLEAPTVQVMSTGDEGEGLGTTGPGRRPAGVCCGLLSSTKTKIGGSSQPGTCQELP